MKHLALTQNKWVIFFLAGALVVGCGKQVTNETGSTMPLKDKLLDQRTILIGQPISDEEAKEVIARLLFLQSKSTNDPILLYINSPGGAVTAGLAILDTMHSIQPDVQTHCLGQAHSMAAIILAAGARGHRSAASTATISFSEVWSGGSITVEKQIQMEQFQKTLLDKASELTGMTREQLQDLFASGRKLTAKEAQDLGIVDQVTER